MTPFSPKGRGASYGGLGAARVRRAPPEASEAPTTRPDVNPWAGDIDTAKAAVLAYLRPCTAPKGHTKEHLMVACGLTRGEVIWHRGNGLPHSRVLDRALQALRIEGKITFRDREWHLVVLGL